MQRVRSLPLARAINPQGANYYKGLTDILLTEKWVAKSAVYALPELSANAKGGIYGCVANFPGGRDRVVHPGLLYAASE